LASLAKAIDTFVADHKKERMAAQIDLLDENTEENRKKLAALATESKLTIPLVIALDGKAGPPPYKLNAEVPITVLICDRNIVKANFALAASADEKAQAKEAEDVLAAAKKMLEDR